MASVQLCQICFHEKNIYEENDHQSVLLVSIQCLLIWKLSAEPEAYSDLKNLIMCTTSKLLFFSLSQDVLPSYKYCLCEFTLDPSGAFEAKLWTTCASKEDFTEWLNVFNEKTRTTMKSGRSYPKYKPDGLIYKVGVLPCSRRYVIPILHFFPGGFSLSSQHTI